MLSPSVYPARPRRWLGGRRAPIIRPAVLRYLPHVSIEVRLTADGIGMVATGVGVLTGQDLLDATAQLREEAERNPEIRYAVMDLSEIPEEKVETRSIRALAAERLKLTHELYVVVVAPSEVLFGISRMWEMMADRRGLDSRVVRTRAEAITWLQEILTRPVVPFRLTK